MVKKIQTFTGGCLCGHIRFETLGKASFPYLCSCRMCRKWSGAPTVAWVNFLLISSHGRVLVANLRRSSQQRKPAVAIVINTVALFVPLMKAMTRFHFGAVPIDPIVK